LQVRRTKGHPAESWVRLGNDGAQAFRIPHGLHDTYEPPKNPVG
jgi:hypothetical protein